MFSFLSFPAFLIRPFLILSPFPQYPFFSFHSPYARHPGTSYPPPIHLSYTSARPSSRPSARHLCAPPFPDPLPCSFLGSTPLGALLPLRSGNR